MSKVVVNEPELSIFDDLREKLLEIRSKRDALAFNHEDLKRSNDNFNKVIIMLSLFTAFCETVKSQLGLTDPEGSYSKAVQNAASILPIFLSTCTGIISSLLKFKKFPEKMEEITKATEKCNFSILRIRQLQENINFQSPEVSLNTYNSEVMAFYRDALEAIEKTMYPKSRGDYFKTAQDNIIKIHDCEKEYTAQILAIKKEKGKLDTDHMEEDIGKNKRIIAMEEGHGIEKTPCDEETLRNAKLSKKTPSPGKNPSMIESDTPGDRKSLGDIAKKIGAKKQADREAFFANLASPAGTPVKSTAVDTTGDGKVNLVVTNISEPEPDVVVPPIETSSTTPQTEDGETFSWGAEEEVGTKPAIKESNIELTVSEEKSEPAAIEPAEEKPEPAEEKPVVTEVVSETDTSESDSTVEDEKKLAEKSPEEKV